MRRIATTLVLALCLPGCMPGEVRLLTGGERACSVGGTSPMWLAGVLVVDSVAGTAIRVDPDDTDWESIAGSTVPVMWSPGFTGRRLPSGEIEVVQDGQVVVTTGRRVALSTQFKGWASAEAYTACGGNELLPTPPAEPLPG